MTTEVLIGVVAFGTAVVGLITAYVSRTKRVIHRIEHGGTVPDPPRDVRDIDSGFPAQSGPAREVPPAATGGDANARATAFFKQLIELAARAAPLLRMGDPSRER